MSNNITNVCTEHTGRFQELGVAIENERGVAENSPDHTFKKSEANFFKRIENETIETTVGTVVSSDKVKKINSRISGDVSMPFYLDSVGYLMANIWGDVTTSEIEYDDDGTMVGTGVYEHDFTLDDSIKRTTLTVFAKEGEVEEDIAFSGVCVDSLSINAEQDSVVSMDFDLVGMSQETEAHDYNYEKQIDFVGKDLSFVQSEDKNGLDSEANELDVKTIDIDFNTGADDNVDYNVSGGYGPNNIFQTEFEAEVTITLNYTGNELKDLYLNPETRFVRIAMEGDVDLVDAEEVEQPGLFQLDFYDAQIIDWDRDSSQDDVIVQEITMIATYNLDENSVGKCKIINEIDTYQAT